MMREYNKAYIKSKYPGLRDPSRYVVAEMGKAMWHFAQLKEVTWYQWGYAGITRAIHYLEHSYGAYIDGFKDLLAQLGLPIEYPSIEELDVTPQGLSETFDMCISLIDGVNNALSVFIEKCDRDRLEPLARKAENIQMENFAPRAWLEQAKAMAETGDWSAPSIDSWMARTLDAPQKT